MLATTATSACGACCHFVTAGQPISWDDAALPDDYKDIGELLNMQAEDVMAMIGAEEGNVCDLDKPHP